MMESPSSKSGKHEGMRPTRLIITKMVLENFKSYAGIQEIGPFHKRFSSIVGPNGSGKSNVIDAMLFVFGKRAKQLRLNKVSELIHKSAGFPNLEFARVSVHFEEIYDDEASEDGYETKLGSEMIVTRTAFLNNQSKYTVDGKTSTFTEVGAILRSHGIDLDNNRFLILQGEVEQIAMMKPKAQSPHEDGLLEYLEDIIGSNEYVPKIEEASKALEEVNETRIEKINRVKIAEKERDNLSGAKQEAELFLDKEHEIRRQKNVLYQAYEHVALENKSKFEERFNKAQEKLAKEKSKLQDRQQRLNEMESQYELARKDYLNVDEHLQKATTEFSAFERRDVKIQEDMKHATSQLKKCQAALLKDNTTEKEAMKSEESCKSKLEEAQHALSSLESKKSEEDGKMQEILTGLQESTAALREKLESAQEVLAQNERKVSVFQTEKDGLLTKYQLIQNRVEEANQQRQLQVLKLEELNTQHTTFQQQSKKQENEVIDLDRQKGELEIQLQQRKTQEQNLQSSIRQQLTRIEECKSILAAGKSSGPGNEVVEAVLRASQGKGPLSSCGVIGRLGDLATIDSSYDVAVSTACGTLDYIVVDTTEGAQRCISYLRDSNIGRASFIVLDQMQEWRARMDRSFATPSHTHRLFDLIEISQPRLRPAFYMALRDTLVASSLDIAVKIAYVGDRAVHRVVTQTGELIDISGSMSGGGKSVKSGGMKITGTHSRKETKTKVKSEMQVDEEEDEEDAEITPAYIEGKERELSSLQQQLSACRQQMEDIQEEILKINQRKKAILNEIEKIKMNLRNIDEQKIQLQRQSQEVERACQITPQEQEEMNSLERDMAKLDQKMAELAPSLQNNKQEVTNIQKEILDVGGPKLARITARIDMLTSQIEKASATVNAIQIEWNNFTKQIQKVSASREKNEKEIKKHEEKLEQLLKEQKEMEVDAMKVIQAVEEAKLKMEEKGKVMKELSAEFDGLKAEVTKIQAVEVDLSLEVEKIQVEMKEHQSVSASWRAKIEQLHREHEEEHREWQQSLSSLAPDLSNPLLYPSLRHSEEDSSSFSSSSADSDNNNNNNSSSNSNSQIPSLPTSLVAKLPAVVNIFQPLEPLAILSNEQLLAAREDIEELKREISLLEAEKDRLKSNVNMNSLLEYWKKDVNYRSRLTELESITQRRQELRQQFEELRRLRLESFMAGFSVISLKLKEMYQMITLGGDAELELVDSLDPFSEGIVFSVRPPKKSWKNISNLSGGEKTLSSLSLVFALHHYKPTPLYVMDEIDAALDFKNVSIVANYIQERTKNAQFIIISLRNNMFELADRLVGIYKTHDATKSVTINPKRFRDLQIGRGNMASSSKGASAAPLQDVTNN